MYHCIGSTDEFAENKLLKLGSVLCMRSGVLPCELCDTCGFNLRACVIMGPLTWARGRDCVCMFMRPLPPQKGKYACWFEGTVRYQKHHYLKIKIR